MTDILSRERRSWNMSRIGSKNTTPELRVRSALHAKGIRFRLHRKDLPGKPDIVLPRHNIAIFVHGCFWHRHNGCLDATMPKSNQKFWAEKFTRTTERDQEHINSLESNGWRAFVIWECTTKSKESLNTNIGELLGVIKTVNFTKC